MSRKNWVSGAIAVAVLVTLYNYVPMTRIEAETAVIIPKPAVDNPKKPGTPEIAVLAGGCFWGVQGVYEHVRGVNKVLAGYAGGDKSTAHYEIVSSGSTGHAESVQVTFDPNQISYGEILQVYFSVAHNPTEYNRQGPDTGTQYRSNIFYANDSQKKIAQAYIEQLNKAKVFGKPVVTRVDSLAGFYSAEDYHQDYLIAHLTDRYIVINDIPKIQNLNKAFPALYRGDPVMVRTAK